VPEATPILMYHAVSESASSRFGEFVVDPRRFEEQMEHLAADGYRSLTVPELVARRAVSAGDGDRIVAITFDDAFAELSDHVFPILERLQLTATVYVPTAYIGATSAWLESSGEGDRRVLSIDEMTAVPASTIEFGAHSHTHPTLDTLPAAIAREEITRSRRILEDALGRSVSTFAYPFGYERRSTRELVRQAGYASACRVGYRHSTQAEDVFALSRIPVYAGDDLGRFTKLLQSDAGLRGRRAVAAAWRPVRRAAAGLRRGAQ